MIILLIYYYRLYKTLKKLEIHFSDFDNMILKGFNVIP